MRSIFAYWPYSAGFFARRVEPLKRDPKRNRALAEIEAAFSFRE
jgi:hypothetical protein